MKGISKTSIHTEERKEKRKRGKIADNSEPIREDGRLHVEKKKKGKSSSNVKRKNRDNALVGSQRQKVEVDSEEQCDGVWSNCPSEGQEVEDPKEHKEADIGGTIRLCKSKKSKKRKKEEHLIKEVQKSPENGRITDQDEISIISSGDEDCSKGMKKWIMEYHRSRPGLKALKDQIDDFISTHEARQEEERKEREARAAEGGWTVVVHHKGRKKTTDSESGIAVGSVAEAAVKEKAAKKKLKEVGLDFYRFQKKEVQRNEIMMLQSKFEEDKRRLQQLRAARKFRPY